MPKMFNTYVIYVIYLIIFMPWINIYIILVIFWFLEQT
jgi:hypothetical protein